MAVVKKIFSNLKLGREHQSDTAGSKWQSGLHRANARFGRKKDKDAAVDGVTKNVGADRDAAAAENILRLSFEFERAYSFEVGASVEDFEIELQNHTRHIRKRLRKQNANEATPSTPASKFGLKVDHVKLPGVDRKAKPALHLPITSNGPGSSPTSSALSSRYGLTVHPSNLASSSKDGLQGVGSSKLETPSFTGNLASSSKDGLQWEGSSKLETPSFAIDPIEDAISASWNSTPVLEGKSDVHVHLGASLQVDRSTEVEQQTWRGSTDDVGALGSADSLEQGSKATDRAVFDGELPADYSFVKALGFRKTKGKARQSPGEDWQQNLHSTPGAYPVVERTNTAILDRIHSKRESLQASRISRFLADDGVQMESARVIKADWLDQLEADLKRERQLEEEKEASRVAALELEAQLQKEQEEAERLATQPKWRECVACADSKNPLDFPAKPPTTSCSHTVGTCSECLGSWMASEFETKGCEGIKCPECPETLTYNDVHRAASTETFEKFDKLTIRNALGACEEFSWCLDAKCGSGQLNVGNKSYMHCASCGYKQCLKHKVAWHKDETCDQYEYRSSGQKSRDEEKATEKMIDTVSKKCPGSKCGWRIQKTEGCEHMTCKKCKHQFCWQCLASHTEIKRVGNTAHAKTCKFHSNNLDVSYPFNAH